MTAFFSRLRRLISAIRGAWRRHSSGVTCARTLSHTAAVSVSTAGVNANPAEPSAISNLYAQPEHFLSPTYAKSEHKSRPHIDPGGREGKGRLQNCEKCDRRL